MSLISDLSVSDPSITGQQPSPLNNAASVNTAGQQILNSPFQFNPNVISNFAAPHLKFLNALSQYAASIPVKSFLVIQFNIPQLISEKLIQLNYDEVFENNDYAKAQLSNDKFMREIGVIFCRSFDFAGEVNNSTVPEMDIRGFRSVPYAGGRNNALFSNLSLSFYESSISFIDHILRPWVILMSYNSTIARDTSIPENQLIQDLKQDITCHLITRTGLGTENRTESDFGIPDYSNPVAVRKTIVFRNCFPKDLGKLEYSQLDVNSLETVTSTFCYTNYEVIFNPTAAKIIELPAQNFNNLQNFTNVV